MFQVRFSKITISMVFSLILTSCGGGSDTKSQPDPFALVGAEGLYDGMSISEKSKVSKLILNDGTFYIVQFAYQDSSTIAYFATGKGSLSDGVFRSNYFRFVSVSDKGYTPNPVYSFQGSIVTSSYGINGPRLLSSSINHLPLAFTVDFDVLSYEPQYQQVANLLDVVGSYSGAISFGSSDYQATLPPSRDLTTLTVDASGALKGTTNNGCTFSGSFAPYQRGNVFNASIIFDDVPCTFAKINVTGHAYFEPNTKRLYVLTMQPDGVEGAVFTGFKN
ncbi:hypothetical protein AAKU64_001818 [Undibacterium sp. GrIS 1.8]|uniref:hypothetical protein n=1 Tax=unclassified Undibacterium TaxID=2630295 RepID=UPI0033982357